MSPRQAPKGKESFRTAASDDDGEFELQWQKLKSREEPRLYNGQLMGCLASQFVLAD